MSGSYSARLRAGESAGDGLGATTVLAAKVAFASAALTAAASLARDALPQLVSGADAFLWKLYLFVTVHVIIFVIWKLSDNKHFNGAAHKNPWAPVPHHPAPTVQTEDVALKAMKRKVEFAPAADVVRGEEFRVPPPVSRAHLEAAASLVNDGVVSPSSRSCESCVTTESEEDSVSSAVAASTYVAVVNSRRNVAPSPSLVRALSLRPAQAMAATDEHLDGADHDDGGGEDDLDATWNAIMERTRPATAPSLSASPPAPRSSPRPRAREPSVGAAELSRRSEEFINKIHHSFGRQQ